MDPVSLGALLTAVVPFITAAAKKVLKPQLERIQDEQLRSGVVTLLPLLLGVLSGAAASYAQGTDLVSALAAGLAAGGVGSSVRDVDKNMLGLAQSVTLIVAKKRTSQNGTGAP